MKILHSGARRGGTNHCRLELRSGGDDFHDSVVVGNAAGIEASGRHQHIYLRQ
jgi:hypothetical protein